MQAKLDPTLHRGAILSLGGLVVLCLLWELSVAPLRPGGSLLALKAVPLLLPLPGVIRASLYTMQWASMLILLYLMEGVVRALSDPNWISAMMASLEILLSLTFYLCAIFYVRPAKKAARIARRNADRASRPIGHGN
jgi:uncharacterized membrane protein